jgi:small subunit ribosomal protein S8
MRVKMPKSKLKVELARVLRDRGYIVGYQDDPEAAKPTLSIEIRYGDDDRPVIEGIERISSPGRRVYVTAKRIPQIRSGLGMVILSTPRGFLTDKVARRRRWRAARKGLVPCRDRQTAREARPGVEVKVATGVCT